MTAEIEKKLCGPYGMIKLRADGHALTAEVRRVSAKTMTYGIALFVDGFIRGEHLKPESEIGAKFYPLRTRNILKPKDYHAHRKNYGKRVADAFKKRCEYQYREAYFRSAKALIAQLKKTCTLVEIAQ
ncbi:MAG TPA: hypothetical protein VGE22_12645 [Solimonas sp.]